MDDRIRINKERQELLKTTINTVVKRIQEDAKVGKLVAQKQLTYKEAFYDEELAQFTCDPGSLLKGDKCGECPPLSPGVLHYRPGGDDRPRFRLAGRLSLGCATSPRR